MSAIYKNVTLLLITLFMLCLSAWAGEINVPVTDYSILHDAKSEIRIVTHIPIPDSVADSTLMFAEFQFAITPQLAEDSILWINCYALTIPWEVGTVDWETPWQAPGGDFEADELTMFTTSNPNDSIAYFDLTDCVRSWLREDRANYGLIFMVPASIASRFWLNQLPEEALGSIKYQTR
ncbi:MAG TPA: hypothetical protein DCZ43_09310 [candidate division Zixibacteria bacterium]|nr:hypothetical protein [candidate division Zixibacteria bacterium]